MACTEIHISISKAQEVKSNKFILPTKAKNQPSIIKHGIHATSAPKEYVSTKHFSSHPLGSAQTKKQQQTTLLYFISKTATTFPNFHSSTTKECMTQLNVSQSNWAINTLQEIVEDLQMQEIKWGKPKS